VSQTAQARQDRSPEDITILSIGSRHVVAIANVVSGIPRWIEVSVLKARFTPQWAR